MQTAWAVVVAAGSGRRYGGRKQFDTIGGRRVVDWSLAAASQVCEGVVLVVGPDEDGDSFPADVVVVGGDTRSESVRAGVAAVPPHVDVVMVHDAARPGADEDLFRRVLAPLVDVPEGPMRVDGVVPGLAVTDTIKRVKSDGDGHEVVVAETVDRSELVAVQTPQAFRRSVLERAHAASAEATDDAALIEALGGRVVVVEGSVAAHKITLTDDRRIVELLMGERS